jgi:hypothetical protein
MSTASNGPPPARAPSQYDRDDDVPVFVSQSRIGLASFFGDEWLRAGALRLELLVAHQCGQRA